MHPYSFCRLGSALLPALTMVVACCGEGICVSSFSRGSIIGIQADGFQTTLARDVGYPTGIASDSTGHVSVASSITNQVEMVHADGRVTHFGRGCYKAGYKAVAFGPAGRLFLPNQDANGLVLMTVTGISLPRGAGLTFPFGLVFDETSPTAATLLIKGAPEDVLKAGSKSVESQQPQISMVF